MMLNAPVAAVYFLFILYSFDLFKVSRVQDTFT